MQDTWYEIDNNASIDTPALLIYPERVIGNIERLKSMVPLPSILRPHVKTNKSVRVSRLMIDRGITKFKCATIAEAEMLGWAGAEDVLLAYQPTKAKLDRFIQLIDSYPDTAYACLVDNKLSAKIISETAVVSRIVISVFIDLNVGMDRTGIHPNMAVDLFDLIQRLPGIIFKGLHAYDGHINDEDMNDRIGHCKKDYAPVEELRKNIEAKGYPFPLLVAGGSPTMAIHSKRANTECSPGTFVFWDKNYHDHIPEQSFEFGALVLTRIVSLPDDTKVCVDLGYKSIACEKPLAIRAFFLNAPELVPVSHSEEHLVLEAPKGHSYKVGDTLYALPNHICPTVAMYNEAYIIENGYYTQKWSIDARK
ncbi:D-TA family PLP-dependent enzyme [Mucilaginibacter sp. UR6-11]|uniref:D-TA family PLP-dependent enzyme n=1 Tax=Mucilaginibacter sp. UR6-11 TaxID=1435644 RepID=UPI001E47C587|nr:D-TA family PLP-dependent enzyme [Mucilaginibacter sp. UR6-11]MCC8426343.1 D-TA family PLP-dependent enzyme [Mucilaginibacter sp. UR6-11]